MKIESRKKEIDDLGMNGSDVHLAMSRRTFANVYREGRDPFLIIDDYQDLGEQGRERGTDHVERQIIDEQA